MVRETRHLWVGNLPENIREDRIRDHFKRYGRVQSVKLLGRKEEENGGGGSGVCATVSFMDIKSAAKAHHSEQKLDERALTTEYHEPAAIPGPSQVYGPSTTTANPTSTPRFSTHGGSEDLSATFDRSSHFYERSERSEGSGGSYLRRSGTATTTTGGYHSTESLSRSRARDRLYRNGPYTPIIERDSKPRIGEPRKSSESDELVRHSRVVSRNQSSHHRVGSSWGYDSPSPRYSSQVPSTPELPYSEERRETTPVVHNKKHSKSSVSRRSGSDTGSNSGSSRSRSSSASSQSGSSTCSSASSSPTSDKSCSTHSQQSTLRSGPQSTVSAPHTNSSSPAVHSEDRRPLAICVRNLPARSSDTSLKDGLYHEYKKHGKVTWVKVVGQGIDRYALVCFKKPEDVEKALQVSHDKLFFGCKIEVAPYQGYDVDDNEFRPFEAEQDEFHPKATRTLFIGNLEKDITTQEIRKHFEQFGEIIDIDIKKQGTSSSYAFCQFSDIGSVVRAMRTLDGEHIGSNRIKLGFGKSMHTNSVWVDGVSESVSEKYLSQQFGQFGPVTHVVIDRTRCHALVFFDQITYAQQAVKEMRGVMLRGRKLQVDYASRECQEAFYDRLEKQTNISHPPVENNVQASPQSTVPSSSRPVFDSQSVSSSPCTPNSTRYPGYTTTTTAITTNRYTTGSTSRSYPRPAVTSPASSSAASPSPLIRTSRHSTSQRFDFNDYMNERRYRGYEDSLDENVPASNATTTAPSDIRLLQKERVALLEQLEDCTSPGDENARRRCKHRRSQSGEGSRPGTPLCDERPENLPPVEPRRTPRDRPPDPLSLPLPKFASHVLSPRPAPPSPPASPPTTALSSSDSEPSPPSPEWEERLRSLDEKYEKWTGSRTGMTKVDPTSLKVRHIKLLDLDLHELQPSDIVKSVLAKRSVFDEDSKRLENFSDKYEPREFVPARTNVLRRLDMSPLSSPVSKSPGLQYPFPSHPPLSSSLTTSSSQPVLTIASASEVKPTTFLSNCPRLQPKNSSTPIETSPRPSTQPLDKFKNKCLPQPKKELPPSLKPKPCPIRRDSADEKDPRRKSRDEVIPDVAIKKDDTSESDKVKDAQVCERRKSAVEKRRNSVENKDLIVCDRPKDISDKEKERRRVSSDLEIASNEGEHKKDDPKIQTEPENPSEIRNEPDVKKLNETDRRKEIEVRHNSVESHDKKKDVLGVHSERDKRRARESVESNDNPKHKKVPETKKDDFLEKRDKEDDVNKSESSDKKRDESLKKEKNKEHDKRRDSSESKSDRSPDHPEKQKELKTIKKEEEKTKKDEEPKVEDKKDDKHREDRKKNSEKDLSKEHSLFKKVFGFADSIRQHKERQETNSTKNEEHTKHHKKEHKERRDKEEHKNRKSPENAENHRHSKDEKKKLDRKKEEDKKEEELFKRKEDKEKNCIDSNNKHKESKDLFSDDEEYKISSGEDHDKKENNINHRKENDKIKENDKKNFMENNFDKYLERMKEERIKEERIKEEHRNNYKDEKKNDSSFKHHNDRKSKDREHLENCKTKDDKKNDEKHKDKNRQEKKNEDIFDFKSKDEKINDYNYRKEERRKEERRKEREHSKNSEKRDREEKPKKKEFDEPKVNGDHDNEYSIEIRKSISYEDEMRIESAKKEKRKDKNHWPATIGCKRRLSSQDSFEIEDPKRIKPERRDSKDSGRSSGSSRKGSGEKHKGFSKLLEEKIKEDKERERKKDEDEEKMPKAIRKEKRNSGEKRKEERKFKQHRIKENGTASDSDLGSGDDEAKAARKRQQHSIFDIVDDEPAYISMYDKVKARSTKNMQKQEEEKRQEKLKEKFHQLKQCRAKREEKKRSTSYDEDSDSEKGSVRRNKHLITSSEEDGGSENDLRIRNKKVVYDTSEDEVIQKNLFFDSEKTRKIVSDVSEDDTAIKRNTKIKNRSIQFDEKPRKIMSDTSEDESSRLMPTPRIMKPIRIHSDESEGDLGFEEAIRPDPAKEFALNEIYSNREVNHFKNDEVENQTHSSPESFRRNSIDCGSEQPRKKSHKKKQKRQKNFEENEDGKKHSSKKDKKKSHRDDDEKKKKKRSERETKKEEKLEDIFGPLSDDSEKAMGKWQVSQVYGSDSESERENIRKKEKKIRDKMHKEVEERYTYSNDFLNTENNSEHVKKKKKRKKSRDEKIKHHCLDEETIKEEKKEKEIKKEIRIKEESEEEIKKDIEEIYNNEIKIEIKEEEEEKPMNCLIDNLLDSPVMQSTPKRPDIPGFGSELDETIHDSAVKSISSPCTLDGSDVKFSDKSKDDVIAEDKPGPTISQEETEDAVAALLMEDAFGGGFEGYDGTPKPETPVSEPDLQIDTDTEDFDHTDFSRPPRTPDVPASFYRQNESREGLEERIMSLACSSDTPLKESPKPLQMPPTPDYKFDKKEDSSDSDSFESVKEKLVMKNLLDDKDDKKESDDEDKLEISEGKEEEEEEEEEDEEEEEKIEAAPSVPVIQVLSPKAPSPVQMAVIKPEERIQPPTVLVQPQEKPLIVKAPLSPKAPTSPVFEPKIEQKPALQTYQRPINRVPFTYPKPNQPIQLPPVAPSPTKASVKEPISITTNFPNTQKCIIVQNAHLSPQAPVSPQNLKIIRPILSPPPLQTINRPVLNALPKEEPKVFPKNQFPLPNSLFAPQSAPHPERVMSLSPSQPINLQKPTVIKSSSNDLNEWHKKAEIPIDLKTRADEKIQEPVIKIKEAQNAQPPKEIEPEVKKCDDDKPLNAVIKVLTMRAANKVWKQDGEIETSKPMEQVVRELTMKKKSMDENKEEEKEKPIEPKDIESPKPEIKEDIEKEAVPLFVEKPIEKTSEAPSPEKPVENPPVKNSVENATSETPEPKEDIEIPDVKSPKENSFEDETPVEKKPKLDEELDAKEMPITLEEKVPIKEQQIVRGGRGGRRRRALGRGGGVSTRRTRNNNAAATPSTDVYEFRDDSEEERPRLILTIKSPPEQPAQVTRARSPQQAPPPPPPLPPPPPPSTLPPNNSTSTRKSRRLQVITDIELSRAKKNEREGRTRRTRTKRQQINYQEKDGRSNIDDTIDDVVRGRPGRRATRSTTHNLAPPVTETVRKSPRRTKQPAPPPSVPQSPPPPPSSSPPPAAAPQTLPQPPPQTQPTSLVAIQPPVPAPIVSVSQPVAPIGKFIRGGLQPTEPTTLIDPVTGLLIPMRESEEGQYIPVHSDRRANLGNAVHKESCEGSEPPEKRPRIQEEAIARTPSARPSVVRPISSQPHISPVSTICQPLHLAAPKVVTSPSYPMETSPVPRNPAPHRVHPPVPLLTPKAHLLQAVAPSRVKIPPIPPTMPVQMSKAPSPLTPKGHILHSIGNAPPRDVVVGSPAPHHGSILPGSVASPPLRAHPQTIVTGASSGRVLIKGMPEEEQVTRIAEGGCIVVPSPSHPSSHPTASRNQVMQAGVPVPAFEASLHGVVAELHLNPQWSSQGIPPPAHQQQQGEVLNYPPPHHIKPAHYVHNSIRVYHLLREAGMTGSYHHSPVEGLVKCDTERGVGLSSPPLELRRGSPHDRKTESPQYGHVFVPGTGRHNFYDGLPTPPPQAIRQQMQIQPTGSLQMVAQPTDSPHLTTLLQRYPVMWQGLLALKADQAAVQMHFVFGNPHIATESLPYNSDGSTPPLRIAQRMRLEQTQVDGVARKMQIRMEHCMMLALPCGRDAEDVLQQSSNLREGLISYLQQKQAAGIINIAGNTPQQAAYVVHMFPKGDFTNENLIRTAPDLLERVDHIPYLLIVIATV